MTGDADAAAGPSDAEGTKLIAQAYAPKHAAPLSMIGDPNAYYVPAADGVHLDFFTIVDRDGRLLFSSGATVSYGGSPLSFATDVSSCLPTKFISGTAVYAPSEPFDNGLATSITRQAWNSPIGYAWQRSRYVYARVLRRRASPGLAYTDWIVAVTVFFDGGGI